jgi:hypothetical protein
MTKKEERKAIFEALKRYGEKHKADYYCIILTPPEGQPVRIDGSLELSTASGNSVGRYIEALVKKEISRKIQKRVEKRRMEK